MHEENVIAATGQRVAVFSDAVIAVIRRPRVISVRYRV
jgi:hypothetical protein